jgi:hypothetical protein
MVNKFNRENKENEPMLNLKRTMTLLKPTV